MALELLADRANGLKWFIDRYFPARWLAIRPWGTFRTLFRLPFVWVKVLKIDPWQRLSLQHHAGRSELWFRLAGRGKAIKMTHHYNRTSRLWRFWYVPRLHLHRLVNIGQGPLVVLEVAWGRCGEDDIRRWGDDYGRQE